MSATDSPVTILSVSESWSLLASVAVGRLVTVAGGQPEIFPVNFVVQAKTVLFRTGEGTKFTSTVMDNRVLFEADHHDQAAGWSVVVKGTARSVRQREEVEDAEQAGLLPWVSSEGLRYVRIVPQSVTGRRFRFDASPPG